MNIHSVLVPSPSTLHVYVYMYVGVGGEGGMGITDTCILTYLYAYDWASLVTQLVKNQPAMQETLVWFLGQEEPLEKG